MGLAKGRDSIHIDKKGVTKVAEFNDYRVENITSDEELAPDSYNLGPRFGSDVKGVVAIDKITSRAEAIGKLCLTYIYLSYIYIYV